MPPPSPLLLALAALVLLAPAAAPASLKAAERLRDGVIGLSAPPLAARLQSLLAAVPSVTSTPCAARPGVVAEATNPGDGTFVVSGGVEFAELPGVCVLPALAALAAAAAASPANKFGPAAVRSAMEAAAALPAYTAVASGVALVLPPAKVAIRSGAGVVDVNAALARLEAAANPAVCEFPLSGTLCTTITPIADCNDLPFHGAPYRDGLYRFEDGATAECVFKAMPRETVFPGQLAIRGDNHDYNFVSPAVPVLGWRMATQADPAAAFFYNPADEIVYHQPLCPRGKPLAALGNAPCPAFEYGSIQVFTPTLLNITSRSHGFPSTVQCCRQPAIGMYVEPWSSALGASRGEFVLDGTAGARIVLRNDTDGSVASQWTAGQRVGLLYRRRPAANDARPHVVVHRPGPAPVYGVMDRGSIPPDALTHFAVETSNLSRSVWALHSAFELVIKPPPTDGKPYLLMRGGFDRGSECIFVINSTLHYKWYAGHPNDPPVGEVAIGKLPADQWSSVVFQTSLADAPLGTSLEFASNTTVLVNGQHAVEVNFDTRYSAITYDYATFGSVHTPTIDPQFTPVRLLDDATAMEPYPPSHLDLAAGWSVWFNPQWIPYKA